MDNYVTIVFDDELHAFEGLHKLWKLDDWGEITMHGAAVIRRNDIGILEVAAKHTNVGARTAAGIGIGALLGAIAGPVGVAAGIAGAATIVVGSAAGLGAAAGGVAGLTADALKSDEHAEAASEAGLVLQNGQSAVVAEVSEDRPQFLDEAMRTIGGNVSRRDKKDVREASLSGDQYDEFLYPYDYTPYFN